MANLTRQSAGVVWVEIRLPREVFDHLAVAYGSRNLALAALRASLPELMARLLERSPRPPDLGR